MRRLTSLKSEDNLVYWALQILVKQVKDRFLYQQHTINSDRALKRIYKLLL